MWLTSHLRSTVVLLGKGTLGTSREIYSEDADDDGSRMRSQPQLRNDKHDHAIRQLDKLNSFPSTALNCLDQCLDHSVYQRGVVSSSPIIGIPAVISVLVQAVPVSSRTTVLLR